MSESWDEDWIVCSCVFFSQCSWWKMWSHRCTYLQKWTLLPLHRLHHSWALTVRDHVPKVVHTCSKFSFEDLIWLQFNNLTFTAARSGEQYVMTGVRDHTETSNEFSVRSKNFLQSRTFPNSLETSTKVWLKFCRSLGLAKEREQQMLLWNTVTTGSRLRQRSATFTIKRDIFGPSPIKWNLPGTAKHIWLLIWR